MLRAACISLISMALCVQAVAQSQTEFGFNDAQIEWLSYEDGLRKAQDENLPVFMLVHTDWCPTCQAYRAQFFDEAVVELASQMVFVIVDRDTESGITTQYARDGDYVPRSMILQSDGSHLHRIHGPRKDVRYFLHPDIPDELIEMLQAGIESQS